MHSGAPFHTLLIRQPALRKLRLSATRRFRRKLDSRFATCSLTREGSCKSRFWATDERASAIAPSLPLREGGPLAVDE